MAGLGILQEAVGRPLPTAVKVTPNLQWKPQNIGDTRIMEKSSWESCGHKERLDVLQAAKPDRWGFTRSLSPDNFLLSPRC